MGLLDDRAPYIDTMREKSDEEILAYSITHPEAFTVLLERYQDAFVRKAYSVLKRQEDAEDVVQEVFSKIYLYADRFVSIEGASFKSWGYRILLNTAFTRYQKVKRDRGAIADLDPEFYESLADTTTRQFEKFEVSDLIVSALAKLPEQMAHILRLQFLEGKSHQEIAEEEGISVGAVKTRVHRAKESLRNTLHSLAI
jgi:RNA polymerase sigma-70 factor (ECF subfamily)